ncbi:MAG TPA: deoxyribonuclease V [Candidatus Binataceae bacterium]|nr:deoxyribonuclease V [Candidatus Binataceae bacterium]
MSGVRPVRRHRWDLTPREAIALQNRMRGNLVLRDGPRNPHLIAGADVAYDKPSGRCFAAVVVMRAPAMDVVEMSVAERATSFPYVPGLLTFREGPALLDAFAKLHTHPDLIMFDGQGYSHPRRFGLASHMGYILDIPSIGCAKSILIGEHDPLGEARGSFAWMIDWNERIGAAVRTRDSTRPIYVSPGHRVGFRAAIRLALAAATKYRIPEPTRIADILVERAKRERVAHSP